MLTNLLVREDFEQWLKSNPVGVIAGMPNEPTQCVLHNFLETKELPEEIGKFWLGLHDITIAGTLSDELLPSWAVQFTRKACDRSITNSAYGTVTFGQCLKIMEDVEEIYLLHELSESAAKKAHEEYVKSVSNDEWWDSAYDYFKDTVDTVVWDCKPQFTLSYSQGDGASFTGEIMALKFIEDHCVHEEYPLLLNLLINESQDFWSEECTIDRIKSRYSHNKTVKVKSLQWQSDYVEGLQEEIDSLQERMQKWVEDESDKLYSLLKDEYEQITSYSAFEEMCKENDTQFNIEGYYA